MPSMCLSYVYLFSSCPIYSNYFNQPIFILPCFCVMLYKFVNKVPRSFQNLHPSFSSVPLAKCRDRKFCLSSVSSKFFGGSAQPAKQRINFHSDLCAVAFRICVRINALLILRVKVFGRFSKNTKSLRAKVMTSPALRLPPELPFISFDNTALY